MGSLVTLGEAMASFTTRGITPLRYASSAALSICGSEATVAIGIQRLGHAASWMSRLGDDEFGELIRLRMLGERVTVHAPRSPQPTGLIVKERPRGDLRRAHYYRAFSAASTLSPEDLPTNVIEQADAFHSSGITAALSDSAYATLVEGINRARAGGTLVSFDVNHRAKLWSADAARSALLPLIADIDILFASLDEAQLLLDNRKQNVFTLARRLRMLGPSNVVITDGVKGAWSVDDSGEHRAEARPAVEVDPFGAGDAFVAGHLATILDGASPAEALERAAAVAALAVSTEGDWEGLPFSRDVDVLRAAVGSIAR